MTILESRFAVSAEPFRRNRESMLALLQRVRRAEADTRDKSMAAKPRFEARGQLLPVDRVGLLLDRDGAFLELATLAGYGMKPADAQGRLIAGGGLIAGIGEIHGVSCMICASDSGIEAGAFQPKGLEKMLRIQEIALKNRLPYVQLLESAGGNLMNYNVENFVWGGEKYRNLARLSAAGIPVITITHGPSTAGGAYQTGLSDYIILVEGRSRAYLAGPALLKAATGETATDEELGGAAMHCSVSGLGDYLARDDHDAIRIAREIVASLDWNRDVSAPAVAAPRPPRYDAEDLLGIMPMDDKTPVDMREVIARLVDDSEFQAFGERYGEATVCGLARIDGMPVGIITNNGPIDPDGAAKATHFIQVCCQSRTPLLYLNNTTGFMVGRSYEEAGSIKHGSKMIQAITNATVPQITLFCGASFGAGHYAMCGRAFDPRFCFSWPNARCAIMGAEQAALTMTSVARAKLEREGKPVDEKRMDSLRDSIVSNFESQMDVFATSARLLDDGVIDPRDTRAVLALSLRLCRDAQRREVQPMQFSVARP
ncbi:acyl-CoA carboxylase subunit beta [Bordetella sp. LUAb4]|uniref:acyl-CoA carboxylase subunit beta n=1 Tax=Bordetella sp. LUAb4 TaxID=2843195 RepID=UPI001E369E7A|nr:carboxyl transferase domain-containing protein [Bordetella sp. LUAb4]